MKTALHKKLLFCYFFITFAALINPFASARLQAQCLTNPTGPGTIPANAPPQNISITATPSVLANSVAWSNGATGSSFTYTPNCNSPGVKTFTPCLLAGTSIPQQNFNVPNFSGAAPATFTFNVSGICYGPGATYGGALPINIGGSGNVNITLTLPDGSVLVPPPLPISTINSLSPVDISLFGLQGDPNGTWSISIGGDATSYNLGPAVFFVNAYNLTETVCGPPVQFTVTPCPAPCPVFQDVIAPAQVCSGANTQLSVQFNVPNAFNVSYQWTGPNGFSSTDPQPVVNPVNTTCDPISVTYFVSAWCTNDNTVLAVNEPVTFTVYPEIDPAQIEIDNTSNILAPGCAVSVNVPCNFTINGTPISANQTFTAGDNGSAAVFTISNGLADCDLDIEVPVTCIGSCTTPTVTVSTQCVVGNPGFRIILNITDLGDSEQLVAVPSQGNPVAINNAGSFNLGPFPNNEYINVKLLNPLNPSCNTNLGNFIAGCVPCPVLVSAISNFQSSSSACEGDIINLSANVGGGTAGVDYFVKWQLNGQDIPGGIGNTYEYILTAPGCEANPHQFTAVLVCLNNGPAPPLSQISLTTINVYPVLQFNVDFFRSPDDCVVLPVASPDCAGNVVFTASPSTNLTPGTASVQVNYTAKVIGAPNSCRTDGRYTVSCPDCNDDAGDATPSFQSLCWGESFTIENTGSLATSPGYQIKWNVTNAANGQILATYGPFSNPGNFSPNTFTNNGSFLPAGQTYCFFPYTVFDGTDINPAQAGVQNSITVGESNIPLNTLSATLGPCSVSPNCSCILGIPAFWDVDCYTVTPGLYSASYTFSGIPYCEGVSAYNITISVDDNTTDLFNPFSQGSISSDFPAPLNQQNDDGTWTLYNYTGDPNGKSVNITAVYLNPIPDPADPAKLSWSVSISYFNNPAYPVVCNSCHDVGQPACVELLPQVQLTPIPAQAPVCAGEAVNLTLLTPDSNLDGTFTWYNGNPNTTGTIVPNPGSVIPVNGQTFYALFKGINNEDCTATQSVTFTVTPLPVLNTPPPLPPVCLGESIDLTILNSSITTAPGTLQWFINDPDEDGALLLTPNNVAPIGSEKYYALFTDAATGCQNKLFVQAVFNPQPILLSVVPEICPGEQADLALLQPSLITETGLFQWYDANNNQLLPNASGQILVNPVNGSTYSVSFTSLSTGCSNSTEVTFTVNTPPALTPPTPTPVCAGTEIDLTLLESQITAGVAGTLLWYLGNPQTSGILLDGSTADTDPAAQTPSANDVYYVVFTDNANGCTNTLSFTYPFAATPALNNPLPTPNFVCGNSAPVSLIALQPQITSQTATTTFEWYKGNPAAGGILLDGDGIPISNDNPASQPIPNGTSVTYFAILTSTTTGCSDTISIVYTAYTPLTGASATYDCNTGIVLNLSGVTGGSGSGYTVSAASPNQPGNFVDYLDTWTVIVRDNAGCTQTLTGTSQCPTCNAGAANPLTNNRVCCGQSINITNTTAALDLPQDYVIGWAITPQSTGPVSNADEVFAADANGLVFQGNEDYSLDFEYSCLGLASDLPAGVYYATPFISERPPEIGPPDPIIYNPGANCDPVGEICPAISGTGWVIDPMIITFPDGSSLNVNQELAFGAPIDETLLGVVGGTLPCLNLASLYNGDPNGTWSIAITNTGTGNLNFSVPDFNITVSADSCTLITQDQVSFVAGLNGVIQAGQTVDFNIQVPSPQVVIPTLTYDPANGCIPTGEFCPQISGTGWAIDVLIITFPDGSQLNINDAAGGLTITEALLGALGGNLPCLGLDSLYQGDPNGTWSFYIHNAGTGTIFFTVPDFDVTTDAGTCTLISEDEVVTIEGTAGAVPPNAELTLEIQIPPVPSLFPAISEICNDYGTPVQLVLLDDISYQSVSATCVNNATHLYSVTVSGLSGGAPGLVPGATYVFPSTASFNAVNNSYTFLATITSFPYTFQIANSVASAGGGTCAASATIAIDPCICIPPVAGFATQCVDDNHFSVIVNLAQLGSSSTYAIADDFGTPQQSGITATGAYTYGFYNNGSQVTVTLVTNDDTQCNVTSGILTNVCTPCSAGAGFIPNNIVCCNDTAHITPQGYFVSEGNIIAWAVAVAPVTGPADLAFAGSVIPGLDGDYGLDFTNANCQLPAGFYYATPFIAQTPGEAPQPDPIVYNPPLGCTPVGEICPLISGSNWIINPMIISFPDGSSINVAQQLIGANVPITPDLLATIGGNLPCIPLSTLYNGDPNGTWTISVNNVGTGAVSFSLPDFNVTVSAAGCPLISQDQVTTIGAVSGTIQGGSIGNVIIQIPNPNTDIPDFPTFDPECQEFGETVEIAVVDPIAFNLTAACNDGNGDGDFDQILVTVSNITGGAPSITPDAQYQLPAGFSQISTGVYQTSLPLELGQTNYPVSVGSTIPGQVNSCETTQSVTLPFCPVGCINPTVLFGAFCDSGSEGQFLVSVNITDFGFGNSTYTISNSVNSSTAAANATGIYQIGPFAGGTPVTVTVTGVNRPECAVSSNPLNQTCISCSAGTAGTGGDTNVVCCGQSLTVNSSGNTLDDGTIVAWALAETPLTNPAQITQALDVKPGQSDGSYEFDNDCNLDPGIYYLTPFIAQTPGEAPQPDPIVYDPALGCDPEGAICPIISGTGWAINPILISFPDGSTINVIQQFLGVNLTITPELLAGLGGLPCIPLDTLYDGNPNGTWTISVTNVGTGAVEFTVPEFNYVVSAATCPLLTEDQVTTIGQVSGVIPGGTTGTINIQVPNPNTEIPDFPTFNPGCQDFGDAVAIVVAEPLSFNFGITCYDPDGDGVSSGYLAAISNIAGGSPSVVADADYVLPAGYVQTTPGVYTKVLPASSSGIITATVGSTDGGCSATQSSALPACFFQCQNPTVGFLPNCEETGSDFYVNANIVNFGAGNASYILSNNVNEDLVTVTATGIYPIGPFAAGTSVTVFVTGTSDAACAVASNPISPDCNPCSAGQTGSTGNYIMCCGDDLNLSLTGANTSEGHVIAWALDGNAVTNATQAEGAMEVWPANADGSYTFNYDCDIDPGVYYLTPFIAEDPGTIVQPDPIVYDPDLGCLPAGEICPVITGTNWVINPLLITFPDGSTINVIEQFLGFNVPITPALLGTIGGLPCIPLSTLYAGDPNGTWTISVNNTGTGAVSFEIPEFNITVSANGCPLITEDQVTTIGAVSGTVEGGTLGLIDIVIPNPAEVVIVQPEPDPIVYDPASGCVPAGEICPIISGSNWAINPLLITFPDGSTINVVQQFLGFNVTVTPALLDAIGGNLPCIPLDTLYDGDPNGEWIISVNNIGTGDVNFEIPEFNLTVSAASCPLLTEDQVTTIGGVSGTIAAGTANTISIQIPNPLPPVESNFPTIDPDCESYGEAVQVILLEDITFNLDVACRDNDGNGIDDDYLATISNINGGAPDVLTGATYTLPSGFVQTTPGVYTQSLPLSSSGNFSATVGSSQGDCATTETVAFTTCIENCVPPAVTFATICLPDDDDNFFVTVNVTYLGIGNTGYTLSNNLNSNTQTVSATGTIQAGPFANGQNVIVTLTGNTDSECAVSSNALTANCAADCFAGTAFVTGSVSGNLLCCNETLSVDLSSAIVSPDFTIGWALTAAPLTGAGGLAGAVAVYPANTDNSIDLTNDCLLAPGTYYLTPFVASATGFPAVDAACEYFGNGIQVTLVNEITFDFTITCNDPDGNDVSDGYLATIGNIAGGAPAILPTATYVIPAGYTQTAPGVYTQILPGIISGDQSVSVGSSIPGLSGNCAATATTGLPTGCLFSCTEPVANYGTACIDNNTFAVEVTIASLGTGLSYTLTDNQGTAPLAVSATGLYTYGSYANNTGVIITITDNNDNECSVESEAITANCAPEVCTPPVVTFTSNCIDANTFEVEVTLTAGSGASYTIADNQGTAAELVLTSGTYSYGVYPNNAGVVISVTDNNDDNCLVVSEIISTDCTPACVPPDATYTVSCINTNLFAIEITLNSGSGNTYIVTDNLGTAPLTVNSPATFDFGEYASLTSVEITITLQNNNACTETSGIITGDCSQGCSPPSVEFSVACVDLNSYQVLINLTALGSSETYTITDNLGAVSSETVAVSGVYSFGPYANGTEIVVTLESNDNSNCNVSSEPLTLDCTNEQLPPNIPPDIIITVPAGGQGVVFNVFDYVTDPNGDPLTLVDMEIPVTGGTLTFNPDGSVIFTPEPGFVGEIVLDFTVTDGNFTVSGTLVIDVVTGLPQVAQQKFAIASIVPVPAKDWVKIDFTAARNANIGIVVYDVTGRLTDAQQLYVQPGLNSTLLNVSGYAAGIYFVTLNNGEQMITGKLVKN